MSGKTCPLYRRLSHRKANYRTIRADRRGGENVAAFVPYVLPPADPPLAIEAAMANRLCAVEQALIRLELAGEMVRSLDWFIDAFVRKEAVVSSQVDPS